jgi:hypothetical protein
MGRTAIAVRHDTGFPDIVAAMRRFAVGAVTVTDLDGCPIGVVADRMAGTVHQSDDLGSVPKVLRTRADRRGVETPDQETWPSVWARTQSAHL